LEAKVVKNKTTLFACAATLSLLAGGCHKSVGGQVIATVNNDEITQQQLNSETQSLKLPPNVDKQKVNSEVAQGLVNRQLLVQEAKAQGLDKQPEYLTQLLKAQNELLVRMLEAKVAKSTPMPDKAAVDKFIADTPTLFAQKKRYSVDQLAFPMAQFDSVKDQLKPTKSLDEVISVLKAHNIPFKTGKGQIDTGTIPPEIANAIAGQKMGEPFIIPRGAVAIANVVTQVTPTPTPDDQAKPLALQILRRKAEGQAIEAVLTKAKASAKIEYAQGFAPTKK
jgi:EpsD family peptidyl-prolyl cis-trans isomerase